MLEGPATIEKMQNTCFKRKFLKCPQSLRECCAIKTVCTFFYNNCQKRWFSTKYWIWALVAAFFPFEMFTGAYKMGFRGQTIAYYIHTKKKIFYRHRPSRVWIQTLGDLRSKTSRKYRIPHDTIQQSHVGHQLQLWRYWVKVSICMYIYIRIYGYIYSDGLKTRMPRIHEILKGLPRYGDDHSHLECTKMSQTKSRSEVWLWINPLCHSDI